LSNDLVFVVRGGGDFLTTIAISLISFVILETGDGGRGRGGDDVDDFIIDIIGSVIVFDN
jgi:hypothetical protein